MLAVYIATKNDTNGNPRRGWILFDAQGAAHGFIDEGYAGNAALRGGHVTTSAWRIEVTPKEYAYWKKRQVNRNKRGSRPPKRTSRGPKRTSRRAR